MAITNFLSNPTTIAELAALVASLFTLIHKKAGYWSLFIPYLIITLSVETAGYYFRIDLKPNYPLYNPFMLIQIFFFSFLFYKFYESKNIRLILVVFLTVFILFFIGEAALKPLPAYNKYSRQFLSGFIVLFSCVFYLSVLKSDIKHPLKYPPFWIVTGLFFYYLGTSAMFAFFETVSKIKLSGTLSFYTLVMGCLSCILYGCWIIAFIWKRKQLVQ